MQRSGISLLVGASARTSVARTSVRNALQHQNSRRFLQYTKYGEVVSKPTPVLGKKLYHPVLGIYDSEQVQKPETELERQRRLFPQQSHLQIPLLDGQHHPRSLMEALKSHHSRLHQPERAAIVQQLTLGQVVAIRRRICESRPSEHEFLVGVVVEVVKRGWESSVRIRNVILKTGVEWKVPLYSPLVEQIRILRRPERVPVGPNLFKLRESTEQLAKYIHPKVLGNEKVRLQLWKQLEQGMLVGEEEHMDQSKQGQSKQQQQSKHTRKASAMKRADVVQV